MLTVFFFARQWRRSGVLTEVELIELRYSGKPARFLRGFKAVYLGLFMNMLILAWVNVALGTILQGFFDLSREQALLITAAAMVVTAIYSSLSGLLGVAITDAFQFVIAMAGCIVLAIIVLHSEQIGGVEGLKEKLAASGNSSVLEFFPRVGGAQTGGLLVITLSTFLAYVGIQWWASWYPGAEPGGGGYVAQRMMSAKNERHSIFATLFFQVAHYAIRPWPWIIVGLCAISLYRITNPAIDNSVNALKQGLADPANAESIFRQFPGLRTRMASDPKLAAVLQDGVSSKDELYWVSPELKSAAVTDEKLEKELTYAFDQKSGYVFAMKEYLPLGLKGLLLVAFFAAYMSTIATQLNWGASYIVNDLYKRFIRPPGMPSLLAERSEAKQPLEAAADPLGLPRSADASIAMTARDDRHYVFVSRIVTLLLMVLGLIASTFVERIEDVWKFLMACGAGLGLVLILRWYWWRINAWGEIAATLMPFVGVAITSRYDGTGEVFSDFGTQLMFIVALTTVSWLIVMSLTRPTDLKQLQQFYQRVQPWGWWAPVSKSLSRRPARGPLAGLIICWISAVVTVYSILFATGKLILHEWAEAWLYLAISAVSLLALVLAIGKTKVFEADGQTGNTSSTSLTLEE
jgi:Na+/proline symporter